jgi:hypothetical protein
VLPAQSVCLVVPIKKIGEYDEVEDDAAGRAMAGSGTQAQKVKDANGLNTAEADAADSDAANANDANANEAQG